MKQVRTVLSTYTADVSGVCSALYELGGMVVIHDPSGCNSTYNTHDEPRWYDMDSLIFISGLSEIDAIMGNDEKFIQDVVHAAQTFQPKFIVLVRSPIPLMTGVDFESIAEIIESECGIPTWFIPTTGMNSYLFGAGEAFRLLAQNYVDPTGQAQKEEEGSQNKKIFALYDKEEEGAQNKKTFALSDIEDEKAEDIGSVRGLKVNILGETPLDYSVNSTLSSLKSSLAAHHIDIISSWAMGESLESIRKAACAQVNLVISSTGYIAARVLEERFHIPYVVGIPMGSFEETYYDIILQSAADGKSRLAYREILEGQVSQWPTSLTDSLMTEKIGQSKDCQSACEMSEGRDCQSADAKSLKVAIVGEPVIGQSIAAALCLEQTSSEEESMGPLDVRVLCPLDADKDVYSSRCFFVPSEESMLEELSHADVVIADPMYRYICQDRVKFIWLPHEAFSGRLYRKDIPDLLQDIPRILKDICHKS